MLLPELATVRCEHAFRSDDVGVGASASTSSQRAQFNSDNGLLLAYSHPTDSVRFARVITPPQILRNNTIDINDNNNDNDDFSCLRAASDLFESSVARSHDDANAAVWRARHRVPVRALSWQRGWLVAADGHGNLSALADARQNGVSLDSAWIPADFDASSKQSFAQSDVSLAVLSSDRVAIALAQDQSVAVRDLLAGATIRRWTAVGVPRAVTQLGADDRVALADDDTLALFDLRTNDRSPTDRLPLTVGDNIQAIDTREHLILLGDCSRAVGVLDTRKLNTPLLRQHAITKYGIAGVRFTPTAIKTPTPAFIVASDEGEVVAIDGARSDVVRADGVLMGFHIDNDGNFFALSERGTLLTAEHWFAPQSLAVPAKVRHSRFKEDDPS